MVKKPIPSIDVPIMLENGSMELAWYLYLKYGVSNGVSGDIGDGHLTLKQDNVIIGEFSANQKENVELNFAGIGNIDGGFANSVYTEPQHIDGGGANG